MTDTYWFKSKRITLLSIGFVVSLYRCYESFNTLDNLSDRLCVPNKIKHVYLEVFNMITGINESKSLVKDILYDRRCRLDDGKCN